VCVPQKLVVLYVRRSVWLVAPALFDRLAHKGCFAKRATCLHAPPFPSLTTLHSAPHRLASIWSTPRSSRNCHHFLPILQIRPLQKGGERQSLVKKGTKTAKTRATRGATKLVPVLLRAVAIARRASRVRANLDDLGMNVWTRYPRKTHDQFILLPPMAGAHLFRDLPQLSPARTPKSAWSTRRSQVGTMVPRWVR